MTSQKPLKLRPHAAWIMEKIARVSGNARRPGAHRNPALRVDKVKPAFIGQIIADKNRLAAGKRRGCKQRSDAAPLIVMRFLEFGNHFALLHGKAVRARKRTQKFQDFAGAFRRLPEMNRKRRAFILQAKLWTSGGEIHESLPDRIECRAGWAAVRLVRKPDFGAVLAHRRKNERRENTIEIADRPPANEAKRAICGASQPGQQRAQASIRDDILWTRLDLKKRAIDIEKIGGALHRRER